MQIISLNGNKEENYYQLGLKDRSTSSEVFNIISSLTKSTNNFTKNLKNISSSLVFKKNFSNYHLVKAYAEGLGKKESEVISFLLSPDLISSINSLTSSFPTFQFGCSSLFFKNETNNISHLRILDFPLGKSYTQNERFIRYSFKGEQKYCGLSTSGLPFPSVTSMNESGLTFALHQKFGHIFNKSGTPIFDIMENLVSQARDLKDILSELKYIQSISTWGIYISSEKENKVLSIDLLGDSNNVEEIDLLNQPLYFNNTFQNKNIDISHQQPLNFHNYCKQRNSDALKKIKNLKKTSDKEVLKSFTTLKKENNHASVVTPSSVLCCIMNSNTNSIVYNNGSGARAFQNQIDEITNIWSTPKKIESTKINKTSKPNEIFNHLIAAQNSWDIKDFHKAIHHAQMARSISSSDILLPQFFLQIFISLSTNDLAMLKDCLKHFIEMEKLFDGIFQDYCKLFIFRLERICFGDYQKTIFKNNYVTNIYEFEKNIPKIIFKKVTRELTSPRLDIQDIIFLHPLKNNDTGITL